MACCEGMSASLLDHFYRNVVNGQALGDVGAVIVQKTEFYDIPLIQRVARHERKSPELVFF